MARHLVKRFDSCCPSALAVFGWLAFIVGLIVEPIGLRVLLMSAARVLPEVLPSNELDVLQRFRFG